MIEGLTVEIDAEAVVVRSARPLTVVSSAVVGGGLGAALAIANLHVTKGFRGEQTERVLGDFARCRALADPWVGLLTAAWTEKA
jgi:adenosylcobinamide amidohydrolase